MSSYAELAATMKKIKRAAIDAYMRTSESAWDIEGDQYTIDSSGAHYKVSRPGADGEGGGDWSTDNVIAELFTGGSQDEEFQAAFETIRARVDAAFDPWLHLPEPTDIDPEIEQCRQVTRGLSGAAAVSAGTATGAGVIQGNLGMILENSSAMAGQAIGAFKSKFIGQLGPAIGGHHGISIILGTAIAGERGIWDAARTNVAELADATLSAFQSLADTGNTGNPEIALQVAGWAVKGVALFATGGVSTALQVGSLGLEVIKGTAKPEESVKIDGSDAAAALTAMETASSKLNGQVTKEEQEIVANLTTNLTNIRADHASYDLSLPTVPAGQSDTIIITPALITEITRVYMPAISTELSSLAITTVSASMTGVYRDGRLGIGVSGPTSEWSELRYLLWELLKNLAWEVEKGAQNLDLVLQDHLEHEASVTEQLGKIYAEITKGSPQNPWD